MRYIFFMLILISQIANSQIIDMQLRVRSNQMPDSILVMSNDTNSASPTYMTGKWTKLSDLVSGLGGGGGSFNSWLLAASGTGGTETITDAETATFTGAGINVATRAGGNVIITGTEVDGSTTNELQDITVTGASQPFTLDLTSDATDPTITGAGIAVVTEPTANNLVITATEVDGSISNELQEITLTGSNPYVLDLDDDATDVTFVGAGIVVLSEGTPNTLTITATEVDGSTTNEAWTVDGDDATTPVVVSNQTLAFRGNRGIDTDLIDGATDSISLVIDGSEFVTVTTAESDDYMLMHDAGGALSERILWTEIYEDLISFYDGTVFQDNGNAIDAGKGLDFNMVVDEANLNLDFSELSIDNTNDTPEDYIILYDPDTVGGHQIQRRLSSAFLQDVNGMWSASNDNTNIANSTFEVGVPGYLDFRDGSEHDLYIAASTDRIGMGTNSPQADLHIVGTSGGALKIEPISTGSAPTITLEGTVDNGDEAHVIFNYTDADHTSSSEQTGAIITLSKQSDLTQETTLTFQMPENDDASVLVMEKNVDWEASRTTESHMAINAGVAFTQNYEWTGTSADLTIDRSYNIINVSGGGGTGDEINMPEVASTSDNWDGTITSAQVQVGQVYVISNFRASNALTVRGFSGDLFRNAGGTSATLTINAGFTARIECVRFSGGVGYWSTWLSD